MTKINKQLVTCTIAPLTCAKTRLSLVLDGPADLTEFAKLAAATNKFSLFLPKAPSGDFFCHSLDLTQISGVCKPCPGVPNLLQVGGCLGYRQEDAAA